MAKLLVAIPLYLIVLLALKSELWQSVMEWEVTEANVLLALKSELWQS